MKNFEAKCKHCDGEVVASGPNEDSVMDAAERHLAAKHPSKVAKK